MRPSERLDDYPDVRAWIVEHLQETQQSRLARPRVDPGIPPHDLRWSLK